MRIIFAFIFLSSCFQQIEEEFTFKDGDFLFQDLDSSPLCEAIENVTPGFNNMNFSHVGIVSIIDGTPMVYEAYPPSVQLVDLKVFLNRSLDIKNKPKVIVGRLKKEYRKSIRSGISFIENKVGTKYDEFFLYENNQFYCSELLYDAFLKDSIFELQPMNYKYQDSNEFQKQWINHFKKLDSEIPQGKLGINPGTMSISEKIEIVQILGEVSKKSN